MAAQSELAIILRAVDNATRPLQAVSSGLTSMGRAAAAPARALGNLASIAGGFALGGGLLQLPGLMMDMAKSAAEDERATARLQQSLRNLSGDFATNLASVNAAIDAGQKLAFSDDDVRDSFQYLAAATGDADEALRRQAVAMDLARGAGISLEQASKMLGKMNDQSADAFRKLGIEIKKGTTEAEALAIVQAKFAGQADTYASSTAGQFEAAQLAFDEAKESLGAGLLPVMAIFATTLAMVLPQVQGLVGSLSEKLAPAVQGLLEGFAPLGQTLLSIGDYLLYIAQHGDFLASSFEGVPKALEPVVYLFGGLVDYTRELALEVWPILESLFSGGSLTEALAGLSEALGGFIDNLGFLFTRVGGMFLNWVEPLIPPLLLQLRGLIDEIGNWIVTTGAPLLGTKLGEWGLAFVNWIGEALPPAISKLGTFLVDFINSIGEGGIDIGEGVDNSWLPAIVDWIETKALPALAIALPKILSALLTFVVGVSIAVGKLIFERLVPAFQDWIWKDVVPALPGLLALIIGALSDWLRDKALPWAIDNMVKLGKQLLTSLQAGIESVWKGTVKPWLEGLPGEALKSVGDTNLLLFTRGGEIIQSLIDGMASAKDGLFAWIKENITDKIPSFIRDLLGIESPSKVMYQIGVHLVEGLTGGIQAKIPNVDAVIAGLGERFRASGGDLSDPQFGGAWSGGWVSAASAAACGAIAAEGFADFYGRPELTVGEILAMAEQGGYWSRAGWTGPGNMVRFLNNELGLPASFTDLGGAIDATSKGKPVAISSPKWFHYLLAQGWDGERFFVGNTGANALRGGSSWMTPGQIGLDSTYIRGFAGGGWLTEPILGRGLRSGHAYSLAERGPELVMNQGQVAAAGGGGGVYLQVLVGGEPLRDMVVRTMDHAQRTGDWKAVVR